MIPFLKDGAFPSYSDFIKSEFKFRTSSLWFQFCQQFSGLVVSNQGCLTNCQSIAGH